jgi:hypothetical protein
MTGSPKALDIGLSAGTAALLLLISAPATQAAPENLTLMHLPSVSARTIDGQGRAVLDRLVMGEPRQLLYEGKQRYALTVQYFALPRAAGSGKTGDPSSTNCDTDGSFSVRICATIYFTIYKDNNLGRFMAGNASRGSAATRLDPTVSLKNLLIQQAIHGYACGGKNWPLSAQGWNIPYPSSGVTYSETPSWYSSFVELNNALTFGQEANDILTWGRGTSTYQTQIIFWIPDHGWNPVGYCT